MPVALPLLAVLVSPRRAAVMACPCNLLLRTLPAIEHQKKPPKDSLIVMAIPSAALNRTLVAEAMDAQDVNNPAK